MALVEPLLEIAKSSHCLDLDLCRETLTGAVDEQRSLIRSVLDAKVVDESEFLKGVSHWLQIP